LTNNKPKGKNMNFQTLIPTESEALLMTEDLVSELGITDPEVIRAIAFAYARGVTDAY
jgi:hypothetical protein